jgi:Tol biopolymer transport system component
MRSRATAGASALVLALVGAGAASATFPGADGRVTFFVQAGCGRYSEAGDPCNAHAFRALLAVSPLSGAQRSLARCPGPRCVEAIGHPAVWSPSGRLLAAAAASPDGAASQVAILTADGALVRFLPVPGAGAEPLGWLPDGRRVAVLSGTRVLTLAATGGPAHALGRPSGPRTWSVRGDVAIDNTRGIYVRRAATGKRRLRLAAGDRFAYGRPDWSPDGRRLAVVRTDLQTRLATLLSGPAGGGRSRVVVRGLAEGCLLGDPVWSPAGTRLAFAATCLNRDDNGTPSVYVVRRDGAGLHRLFDPGTLTGRPGFLELYVSTVLSWQGRP